MSVSISPGRARLVAFLCFLIASLEGYDIQSFGVAAPVLATHFGLGAAALGIAGSAAMIGLVVGAFSGGWLAERRGPKLVLLISTLLFAIFSLATAASQSFEGLLLARFATGIGFGGAMSNLLAIATRLRPAGRHASLTTLIFCGMPVGGALVSLIARAMGPDMDWRLLFAIGGIAPLLLVPLIGWLLPTFTAEMFDQRRQPLARALFGEGRWRVTLPMWCAFALTLLLLYLFLNWLPVLVADRNFSAAQGAGASLSFNLCGIAGSLVLGALADKFGFRLPLAGGFTILFAGAAVLAQAGSYPTMLAAAGTIGAALVGLQYLLYALAPTPYSASSRIAAAGAAIGVGRLGSILGPVLAGFLRQAGISTQSVLMLLLPVIVAAGLAAVSAATSHIGQQRDCVVSP